MNSSRVGWERWPPANAGNGPARLLDALGERIVGQNEALEAVVVAAIAGGHILLEGPPGVAKTALCRAFSQLTGGLFRRIQCTIDLLPADVLGCEVFDQRDCSFQTRMGPIFSNVLLIDEINRSPARAQAALFEAMEERQVTIGAVTYPLPDPFVVLATMNETDAEGVYPLPAAQLDRFLLKVVLEYPQREQEMHILTREKSAVVRPNAGALESLRRWREECNQIFCAPQLIEYIVDLARATRASTAVLRGAGPRASLSLLKAARARALISGRQYVALSDITRSARSVLRHRIVWQEEPGGDRAVGEALAEILSSIAMP